MPTLSIATIVLIAVNVIISLKGFNDFSFFEKYKFNVAGVRRGEQIRFFSSAFLHVNFQHLLFNMITLYFFADYVIAILGTPKFLMIYVASLLLGNLLSYYFHKNEYHYSAVGASGAVMGILYSAILLYPHMSLYMYFIPIPIPGWIFGVVYLLYSIYGMKSRLGNIGHDAHFGGAIAGYVLTLLFVPSLLQTSLWLVGLLAIPIIILLIMHKLGKI